MKEVSSGILNSREQLACNHMDAERLFVYESGSVLTIFLELASIIPIYVSIAIWFSIVEFRIRASGFHV